MNAMRASLLLATATLPGWLRAQVPADTAVTVMGIVRETADGPVRWGLMLPVPLVLHGVRFAWLQIEGASAAVAGHQDQFVRASGLVRLGHDPAGASVAVLAEPRLEDRNPPHSVNRIVQPSLTQRAAVSLAVEPPRWAWDDTSGAASGVQPVALFSVLNNSDVPIRVFFSGNEVICVRVRSLQPYVADTTWSILQPGVPSSSIRMGQRYRGIIELPRAATPRPGRYRLRVELCAAREYAAELQFEVDR